MGRRVPENRLTLGVFKVQKLQRSICSHLPPMANKIFLSAFSLVLLLGSAFAIKGQCDITRINAQEPSFRLESEGGVSEFWDHNSDEFQCAGVSFHRHTIRTRGLMLPVYHNAPVLAYVLQGRGIYGVMISGCPETYEAPQQQSEEGYKAGQKFTDRHQKIEYLKQGDIIAIRAGEPHWAYNNGDEDLVVVVLQDNSNNANQLDQNPRSFFLAGNPERGQEQQQQQMRFRGGESRRSQHQFGNIFKGFDVETLSEVFDVDQETARKLQSENDERGLIVIAERGLQVIRPPSYREEEYRGRSPRSNGLEETICSAKIKENIDKPSRADIYNPQAGRLSTVNSFTLPILSFIKLSFAKGVLYKNAITAPKWFVNAHTLLYITRGESRMQVVNHNGQAVFDGQVREGQVVVVPQNFAVVKQAEEQGCEWVEFQTNENAMYNTLTGRTSALRGLPVDVVATAYQVSREEAERLKFSRRETLFFSASRSRRGRVATV